VTVPLGHTDVAVAQEFTDVIQAGPSLDGQGFLIQDDQPGFAVLGVGKEQPLFHPALLDAIEDSGFPLFDPR